MEVNTPIAFVCFERALPLPTSSPLMHNQLSKPTYLPEACETLGTRLAAVQKVPICKNLLRDRFSERLDFFFALTLIDIAGATCVWCTAQLRACLLPRFESRCLQPPEPHTHTYTHLYTCWCFPAHTHTHTHRPKGGKGTKEKLNDLHAS